MALPKQFLRAGIILAAVSALLCCGKYTVKPSKETSPVYFQSASELTNAIRSGEITSTALLNLYLERIERYDDKINAVVALDIAAARARADAADRALAKGQDWGPLHGLPMTVKDVFEVTGMPTTSGDPSLTEYIPKQNAIAVQRLIDAGAVIFGKTNVPYHAQDFQTFNAVYGTTSNPWDLSRTPGGSSGGSAAALAAGLTSLELGSDIAGSLRFPAHYTGVYGHKPTFGIVPRYGHIPPLPETVPPHIMPVIPLFVVGPIARSADDLELALEILTTPGGMKEKGDGSSLLPVRRRQFSEYRVAVWLTDDNPAAEIDAQVLAPLQKVVDELKDAGLDVDESARPGISLRESAGVWVEIYMKMMSGDLPLPEPLADRQKAQQAKWNDFFKRYDVLLVPVSSTAAFPHEHTGTISTRSFVVNGQQKPMLYNMSWAYMATVAGLPATVAPVGFTDSGLPVGIQIIGARFEDRTTIAFARGLSELMGGFTPPPGYAD